MNIVDIPAEDLYSLLRDMVLIRRFEEKIIEVYGQQDMKSPVHLYLGQEAIAAAVCFHLTKEDYLFTTHRSHGHCLAKGTDPKDLYAEFYGRSSGCCHGKGGSMHPADPDRGILGTSAIVGGGIPLAVGTALASNMRNDGRVSVSFFGDGASEEGSFHESLNFASIKKLPVVFVCENNFYAVASPIANRQPNVSAEKRAAAYGIPGVSVDGNDILEIFLAAKQAIERAKAKKGPTFIECSTYRWKGHVGPECDSTRGCRPLAEIENWINKCPIQRYLEFLTKKNVLQESDYIELVEATDKMLDKALREAKQSPLPDEKELMNHIFSKGNAHALD